MRNWRHIGKWIAGVGGALLLLLLLLLYTPPGLGLVARLVGSFSGGTVRIEGLGGFLPNHITADRIEIADTQGTWLKIEQVSLRWSALAAISNHIVVEDVSASRIAVLRQPVPSGKAGGENPQIDVDRLSLPRIEIAAALIGHDAVLSAAGALHFTSLHQMNANLIVSRTGSSDSYRILGGIAADVAQGTVTIREGADGILGKLAGLPGLGPVNLTAQAGGDSTANTLALALSAGPLKADGRGTIQLASQRLDMDLTLAAPAMKPRPDIGWQTLSGETHIHGSFDAPVLQAHLLLNGVSFADLNAGKLEVQASGQQGSAQVKGVVETLTLPGSHPDIFAHAPLQFEAQANLKAATRPVSFAVRHPLVRLQGLAQTQGDLVVSADLTVPSLAPLAALEKVDMRGSADFRIAVNQAGKQMKIALTSKLDTQGTAIPARLLGRSATLDMNALLDGSDMTDSHIRLHGDAITTDVSGSLRKGALNYRLALDLTDLSRMTPVLLGTLSLRGDVHGPLAGASLSASGNASMATKGFARQQVAIDLKANGLPALHDARLTMDGRFDGAPLLLHAGLDGDKTRNIELTARWKSLNAKAALTMPQGGALTGTANIALQKLADLAVFTGDAITGTANAALTLKARGAKSDATLQADLTGLKLGDIEAQNATVKGTAADLMGKPVLGLALNVQGVAAQGFKGDAQAQINGPLDKLGARLEAALKDGDGGALTTQANATFNIPKQQITLNTLDGSWRGTALKLDAPATIDLADGMAVDHLAAHLAGGTITASGRIAPKLALSASAHNIALENFRPFLPQIGAQGTISATAELSGSIAAPLGTITLQGRELRAAFSGRAVPAAAIDLHAQLAGDHATVNASVKAGTSAGLTLQGSVPIAPTGTMALRASGTADLSLIDPFLAASGRRVRGTLTLSADIGGTMAAPRVTGNAKLAGGELQDYARGARIHDITATIQADGTRIRLVELTGRADPGTITGSGSIDLSAPGMPVDFALHAQNARPIVSDLVTATLSGDVKLAGRIKGKLDLSGKLQVVSGDINLPENLPPDVAVLNVRRRGQAPPPPPAPSSRIGLDVDVRTTGHIFVRGHGLDADMGGAIHVGGTSTEPLITGGFRMNRGSYSVAGQTLDFTTGRIRFDGIGVRGRLDPTLEFVAQTVSGGVTATLTITGYASAPKIALSSSPQLPQDEVVAHLLFQQSVKQLTPLQLASIAQALAAMGGVGGGFNPLGTVRKTLGLDRLAVGSANGGATGSESQTTVEAGRYVMRNVYVGVKQNLSGGTQTQVQVDITRRLKAQATVATGTDATATKGSSTQDNGSSIGLSYQFEY